MRTVRVSDGRPQQYVEEKVTVIQPIRFPLEFRAEGNHEETRVMGLSYSEDSMIVALVVLTQCQRVTDRQTDRRTDRRTDLR